MMRSLWAPVAIAFSLLAPSARAEKLALVQTGAGFLVADGVSVIPLEIVPVGLAGKIQGAKITAKHGRVQDIKVAPEHVLFRYHVPPLGKKKEEVTETLSVALELDNGGHEESFTFKLGARQPPSLDLLIEPTTMSAADKDKKKISVSATAEGRDLVGIDAAASPGPLADLKQTKLDGALRALGTVSPVDIPPDQPSYVLALAAASSKRGFAIKSSGVSVEAPIRISVEIPAGTRLLIEGATNSPEEVKAPADGKTVIENVMVRYGTAIRAFSRKGPKKTEVPVVVPASLMAGLAIAIPGQAVADGGIGPTIAVAIPPAPFGGSLSWPSVQVEGTPIVKQLKIAPDVYALVIKRPERPAKLTVLLDDEPVGAIEIGALSGRSLEIAGQDAKGGERGAAEIVVKDGLGQPTDAPAPRVRIEGGAELAVERVDVGRYRAGVPVGTPGVTGDSAQLVAEILPPFSIAGASVEAIRGKLTLRLTGPQGAIAATDPGSSTKAKVDSPQPSASEDSLKLGLAFLGSVGTTFNSLLILGGGIIGELRLPMLEQRLAIRAGLEIAHASGSSSVDFNGTTNIASQTTIAGLLIPVDVGFAVVHTGGFELVARAGAAVRVERGVIEVNGSTPGGSDRVGVGGTISVDSDFDLGSGSILLGATLGGIGANANGLSFTTTGGNSSKLSGQLINVRGDIGYRLWF
jgi:hypothetical protein